MKMKNDKVITVKELREQLERLEKLGCGDWAVWFRDEASCDSPVELGVIDNCPDNIVIG